MNIAQLQAMNSVFDKRVTNNVFVVQVDIVI